MTQETSNPTANLSTLCKMNINPQTDVAQWVSNEIHNHCPGYYSDWSEDGKLYSCQCPHHVEDLDAIAIAL